MERRKTKDRRANDLEKDQALPHNRRYRTCRRLNNIFSQGSIRSILLSVMHISGLRSA